jgi:ABC-2 type transport system permease protein
LYLGLIIGTGYITANSGRKLNVALIDSSGNFTQERIDKANTTDSSSRLTLVTLPVDSIKGQLSKLKYDGYLVIPSSATWDKPTPPVVLHSSRTLSMEATLPVQTKLNNIWRSLINEKLGIDEDKKKILEQHTISLIPQNINDEKANSGVATIIGSFAAILIYIILMLYGSQVMMGVMEEKTSRIAEVIISSVKPFQLMIGKILGIGLVCLTQILLWILFIVIIYNVTASSGKADVVSGMVGSIQQVFASTNMPLVLFCFIFLPARGLFLLCITFCGSGQCRE